MGIAARKMAAVLSEAVQIRLTRKQHKKSTLEKDDSVASNGNRPTQILRQNK